MPHDVTVVLTGKSIERILREGGTSSWRLDRKHARQRPYVLCTRNANADWVEGSEPHRSAFLIGKLSEVLSTRDVLPGENPENRYLLKFSEYALIEIPDVWKKGDRNPVKYMSLEDFDIDPAKLVWMNMPLSTANASDVAPPSGVEASEREPARDRPLSMAEAKRGLALTFSVPPSAIEITIRG
jgi:hypothetical protein